MSLTLLSAIFFLMSGANAFARSSVQEAECFGSSGSPVSAIYMGGMFPPSGSGGLVALEEKNRRVLQNLAEILKIRIAVPLARVIPTQSHGPVHAWNGYGLGAIESMATSACGGTLAEKTVLIGFSSGAIQLSRILDSGGCGSVSRFSKVLVVGAQKDGPHVGNCSGRVAVTFAHSFPPPNLTSEVRSGLPGEGSSKSERQPKPKDPTQVQ